MIEIEMPSHLDSNVSRETTCFAVATAIHILMFLWNPVILRSDFHPAHDFVTVDVVETPAPGGGGDQAEAPKKSGLMETLKDMLSRPKAEEIAHVAPEPVVPRVAAPLQPALKERTMPRPIASNFVPKAETEDIASANTPSQIQTNTPKIAALPGGGPTLSSKSFGGIRSKDLPFAVGGEDSIASGGAVVPIAVGNRSAKAALNYGGASLQEKGKHMGIASGIGGGLADVNSIGGGGPTTIALSGTGGTGNAPTGATSGSSLRDRAGSGSGFGSGRGFGGGRGSGIGSGVEGIPSAAQQLDQQIATAASGGGAAKKGKQAFELAGPLNNRPISHKVIPQYPAWAEEQGIIGSVRLYFTVTPEGVVRSNIRVTKTTGYPQLDQLGIDALKQWKFAPLSAADEGKGEWGILTFNFSLSS